MDEILDALDRDPRVRVSSSGSWLDAERDESGNVARGFAVAVLFNLTLAALGYLAFTHLPATSVFLALVALVCGVVGLRGRVRWCMNVDRAERDFTPARHLTQWTEPQR